MSIPVLVRSVGPEPSAGYYTQWTTFEPGYPKFKNQDTGVTSALYNGAAIEANLVSYRAHHLYFTGTPGQTVDRLVDIPVPLPGVGEYYDIAVTPEPITGGIGGQPPVTYYPPVYTPPLTAYTPTPGASSGTEQPTGPARLDITVTESFALSTGDAKVTPWMSPRYVQEREIQTNRWANLDGAKGGPTPASVSLSTDLSTQLVVQDFGFRLPNGAVVQGIEIEVDRKVVGGSAESSGRWLSVGLISGDESYVFRSYSGYQYLAAQSLVAKGWHVAASDGQYAVASGNPPPGQQAQILYSSDYGKTWATATHSLPVSLRLGGVAIKGNVAIASVVGYTDTYKVLRSTDHGATWSIIDTGFSAAASASTSIPATNGTGTFVFGTGDGDILYSTNSGATWTNVASVLSTTGDFNTDVYAVLFDGVKFVAIANAAGPGTSQAANSADGVAWTLRYQAPAGVGHNSYISIVDGNIAITEASGADRRVTYSADHGDTWARAAYPADVFGNYFYSVIFDPIRSKYLFFGTYADAWSVIAESPDFPPTSFRVLADTEAEHHGESLTWMAPLLAGTFQDRYGVRYEEVRLLVGGTGDPLTPADAIYDEGLAIPGGAFAYRETFLSMDGAQDDLRNAAKKTFGGPDRRGSDPNVEEGARAWTAAEVNAPSFGFGYQAEGSQGVLQLGDVRMRIHYRADPTADTLPTKRSNGLAGVAESPSGVKVAVGVDGKILRKPANNPTWSAVSSGTTVSLNAVEWVGDRFIAVGMFGMALDGGADGSTWARVETGAVTSLWAIRRVPDTLRAIAVGNDDFAFERSMQGGWSV